MGPKSESIFSEELDYSNNVTLNELFITERRTHCFALTLGSPLSGEQLITR